MRRVLFDNEAYTFLSKPKQNRLQAMRDQIHRQLHKVSHDMRTPLNAIINMLQCLSEVIDQQVKERYLSPALSSCQLLMNLLSDILDLA